MANNKGKLRYFIGRKEMMKCGQIAEIIEYIDCHHLRVRFEDGTELIREPVQYERREIRNPNIERKIGVGTQKENLDGILMTVVEVINPHKLKIRFSDGVEKTTSRNAFDKGTVMYPGMTRKDRYKSSFLGQIKEKNGHKAVCIDTIDKDHLIIEFDTGEKRTINSTCWKRDSFLFPGDSLSEINSRKRVEQFRKKLIGMRKTNNSGLEMVCTEAVNCNDITVKFIKSGYTTHCKSKPFLSGTLIDRFAEADLYIGKRVMQLNGMFAECTEYEGPDRNRVCPTPAKYVITFDDGTQYINEGMHAFLKGELSNPNRPMIPGSIIHNIEIIKKEFNLGTEPQMKCQCTKCGWKDIASFDEIYNHTCETNNCCNAG